MKTTERFKEVILNYLTDLASKDELFSHVFARENKNINDCITYILNTVKKSGCNGFSDEEIYSMAIHYYQEEIVDPGKACDATVIINQKIKLTEEELKAAKEKAIDEAVSLANTKMLSQPPKKEVKPKEQMSLF